MSYTVETPVIVLVAPVSSEVSGLLEEDEPEASLLFSSESSSSLSLESLLEFESDFESDSEFESESFSLSLSSPDSLLDSDEPVESSDDEESFPFFV